MVTIPVELSNELARKVMPLRDRLPEIIELGLRQINADASLADDARRMQRIQRALAATGIVTVPVAVVSRTSHRRSQPIAAGGPPASSLIIAERRGEA